MPGRSGIPDENLAFMPLYRQAEAIRCRRISASEALLAAFENVDGYSPKPNAVVWQDRDAALLAPSQFIDIQEATICMTL